jgi:hypothetical protein
VKNRGHSGNKGKIPEETRRNANHKKQHACFRSNSIRPRGIMADNECTTMRLPTAFTEFPADSSAYNRAAAWALLTEWTQGESLRKHALGVETCVLAYGEAEADRLRLTGIAREELLTLYATTALLHDFDYERIRRSKSIPSSACANWRGWAGLRRRARRSWATPATPACPRDTSGQGALCLR